jgi:hypothetical protein
MTETPDVVMPILRKIHHELTAIRREQKSSKERDVNMTDTIIETQTLVASMRKDNLQHLGLTTKHKMAAETLEDKVEDLSARISSLEARV